MEPYIMIICILGLLFLLLFAGASLKPVKWIGSIFIKIVIGALLLFFVNSFGTSFGLHVPINIVTSSIAGLLGLPGLAALVLIKMVIIP